MKAAEHGTTRHRKKETIDGKTTHKNGARKTDDVTQSKAQTNDQQEINHLQLDAVSITTQPRTSFVSQCFGACKYLLLFIIIPPFLNYAALQREASQLKPPGQLYDIGQGQRMYLGCQGTGLPTVILDASTGMNADVWAKVQPAVAKFTKVCVYDRAGLGYSERPHRNYSAPEENLHQNRLRGQEFTVERMADDLRRLITTSSQQQRPLVLVGAEMGALVARFYAQLYESDVSHLLLLDPLVEDIFHQDEGVWAQFWFHHLLPSFQALQLSASLGTTRLALLVGLIAQPIIGPDLPAEIELRQKHLLCQPRHLSSVVDEHHFINDTFSQMRTLTSMKALPSSMGVTVLTGNYYDEQLPSSLNKAWAKSVQLLLSRLPPSTSHIVVNGADHRMLYRNSQVIVEHISRAVKRWRTKSMSKKE